MKDRIRQLLAALGEDPARKLRDLGIEGWPRQSDDCPIFNYLKANGVPVTFVSRRRIEWEGMHAPSLYLYDEFPEVSDFVIDFDRGGIDL